MKIKNKLFSSNFPSILTILFIISTIWAMQSCKPDLKKPEKMSLGSIVAKQNVNRNFISIQGVVSAQDGKPLGGAHLYLHDKKTIAGKGGSFRLYIEDIKKSNRLLLKITKKGYADRFVILKPGHHFKNFKMVKAKEISFDPTNRVVISSASTGSSEGCWTSVSKIDWTNFEYLQQHYKISPEGIPEQYNPSPELAMALSIHDSPIPCSRNFTVSIPGKSLESADGSLATETVIASVSSVNLSSTWQMPGDYSVQIPSGDPAYMLSYGAGQIKFQDKKGRELNLKKGSKSEIILPVDPLLLGNKKQKFPPRVPLLIFNETSGMWEQENMLEFDSSELAYKGSATHFSVFNADDVKNPPATLRLDARKIKGKVQYAKIGVTYYDGQPVYIEADDSLNLNDDYHLIYNLPPNAEMSITFMGARGNLVDMPNMATTSGDLETEPLEELLQYPYEASNKTFQLFYDPVPTLQDLAVGIDLPQIDLRVTYNWNGWSDAPSPSNYDKIKLFHISPGGSLQEIASLLKTSMAGGFGDFQFNDQSNPELFTLGTHRFYATAFIYNSAPGGLVSNFHVSPNSNDVYKTYADTSPADVRINNYINFPVSEIRTSENGGISWSASYGQIPAQTSDILMNVPQNNLIRIRTSYWSATCLNDWIDLKETDWNFSPIINVPDPWPDVIVGPTWRGYTGDATTWEMQFFSDYTFRWRYAPPLENFTSWTTENYSLNTSDSSSYSFTAGGAPLTYYIENLFTCDINQIWWPANGLAMNPY